MKRKKTFPPPSAATPHILGAFSAAYAAWLLFITWQTLSGSGPTFRQGLGFFYDAVWAARPPVVPWTALAREYALDLLSLSALALAADGLGATLLHLLRCDAGPGLERRLIAQGLGLGTLSLAALILGAYGLVRPSMAYGLVVLGGGLAIWRACADPSPEPGKQKSGEDGFDALSRCLLVFLVYIFILHLIGALGPETFYDSLVYHLAAPKLCMLRGAITPIENNLYANFPQNVEMLYLLGLLLKGELAAKLLHFWMMALTVMAIYGMGRTYGSRRSGLLAAAFFACIPTVSNALWHTGVELGTAFWQTLGAWALLRAFDTQETRTPPSPPRWLVVSGLMYGFSLGAKYTAVWGAFSAFAVICIWLIKLKDLKPRGKLLRIGVWCLAASAVFLPWLVKNWLLTGNPVYPFLAPIFGTEHQARLAAALAGDARGEFWYGGLASWKTFIMTPWQLFVKGRSAYSFIGPVLVAFAPLFLLARATAFPFGWIAALFLLQYAAWSATTSMIRLFIPSLPLCCLYAADRLEALGSKRWSWSVWPMLAWYAAWTGMLLLQKDVPGVVFGYKTRSDFLTEEHFTYQAPYYDVAVAMDTELAPSAKILLVGDARSYHLPRDSESSSAFDGSFFMDALAQAASVGDMHEAFRKRRVTHILMSFPETSRVLGGRLSELAPEKLLLLSRFMRACTQKLRQSANNIALYELVPPRSPIPISWGSKDLPTIVRIALRRRAQFHGSPDQDKVRFLKYLAD